MKPVALCLIITAGLFAAGCHKTRSISDSGYHGSYHGPPGTTYRELSEFDVLGVPGERAVSDEEIETALQTSAPVKLKPGSNVLLIQSGAVFPDGPMVAELSRHFTVVPFSGMQSEKRVEPIRIGSSTRNVAIVTDPEKPVTVVPLTTEAKEESGQAAKVKPPTDYSRALRLAAARSGCETIICYWGIIESGSANLPTKTISWVPIVRWVAPDEHQHMRLRLKLAVIDVRTGNWTVVSPAPAEDDALSLRPRREAADQKQVERLKARAYEQTVKELMGATELARSARGSSE